MAATEHEPPRLRPLGFGELLDVAFKICLSHNATLLRIVLVIVVPLQALATVIAISTVGDDFEVGSGIGTGTPTPADEEDFEDGTFLAGQAGVLVLLMLTFLLTSGACFRAIGQAYLGLQPGWRSSLAYAARKALPLLWLTILYGLGLALGFLLLIVPGIFLYAAWGVAYPALMVEDIRGRKALGRSRTLVKDRWWRTAGILLFGLLLATMLSSMVQFAIALPIFVAVDDDTIAAVVLNALALTAGQLISTPLSAAIVALLYFDLRVRREGFDLELLAERLGGGGAVPAAEPAAAAAPERPAAPGPLPRFLPPQAPRGPDP